MSRDFKKEYGEIISILIKDDLISEKQLDYAVRVQSKLSAKKPLLEVLKELEYVTVDDIKKALRSNDVSLRIGRLLVELGYITERELRNALEIQEKKKPRKKLGEILVSQHLIDEDDFLEILSLQLGYEFIDTDSVEIDKQLFLKAPVKWYKTHRFIPIRKETNGIVVAFADPSNETEVKGAKEVFGSNIVFAVGTNSTIHSATIRAQKQFCETEVRIEADDESIVGIVNTIIAQAIDQQASDIHLEPTKDHLNVRFRQDGVLLHHKDYPRDLIAPITSRIKIIAEADIAEKRRHQGGRILFDHLGRQYDLRVSFYVTIHGEKIVLRVLNQKGRLMDITEIGMAPKMLARFQREALEVPSGVTLITGPTGSGKTSTVYSCVTHINNPETCIITAEDPVEIVIDGIAQCSINPRINLTFDETLKHIVRQDPDVIVIGEIRDNFSAEVAVQAALTGHKVLTTFHTEDSIGGLIRLLNMDIEAFLISSTVVSVVAQRLLRKVCPKCQESYKPTPMDLQRLGCNGNGFQGADFRKGSGCSYCRHTGYKGRVAVFELLVLDEMVRDAILNKSTSFDIRRISTEETGLVTLLEDGLLKAVNGLTTIDEVLRCVPILQKPRELSEIRRLVGE